MIVLICRRFLKAPYVTRLPADWTGGRPSNLLADDAATAVRKFFADDERAC